MRHTIITLVLALFLLTSCNVQAAELSGPEARAQAAAEKLKAYQEKKAAQKAALKVSQGNK